MKCYVKVKKVKCQANLEMAYLKTEGCEKRAAKNRGCRAHKTDWGAASDAISRAGGLIPRIHLSFSGFHKL
jgi:hypothetical protein